MKNNTQRTAKIVEVIGVIIAVILGVFMGLSEVFNLNGKNEGDANEKNTKTKSDK